MDYIIIGAGVFVILLLIIFIASGYQTAAPDEVKVITGLGKETKYISGGSAIILPGLQKVDRLTLQLVDVDVDTTGYVPTKDFINIKVDGNATLQISSNLENLELAKKSFLNLGPAQIADKVVKTLEANVREIIGTMLLKDISQDKEGFSNKVQEITQKELGKLGIDVLNLNIQSFEDDSGVIKDLGIENIQQIKKDALIAASNAQRETAVVTSENLELSEKARIDQELRTKELETDANIKKAEMDRLVKIEEAKRDMAYQVEQERLRKELEEEIANANIMKAEKGAVVEQRKAEEYRNKLEGTRMADAEAERFEEQKKADAKAYEIESLAKAMEVEASAIKKKGLAEAEVIKAKAEAENIVNEKALTLALIDVLPQMAEAIAASMAGVDSINLYGNGAVEEYHGQVATGISASMETMKSATGFDITDIINAAVTGNAIGNASSKKIESTQVNDVHKDNETEITDKTEELD